MLACLALVLAALVASGPEAALSTTGSASVSVDIPGVVSLANDCDHQDAWDMGTITPPWNALTDTGANVCSFSFDSNESSTQIRMYQSDGQPGALTTSDHTWSSQVGWTGELMSSAVGASSNIMWTAGPSRRLFKSTTTGTSWVDLSDTVVTPIRMSAKDDDVLYISSWDGDLRKSANGGTSFVDITTHSLATNIYGLAAAPGTDTVWIGDETGGIQRSLDQGVGWTSQAVGLTTDQIMSMHAIDANMVFAVTQTGDLLRTTNGGVPGPGTWEVRGTTPSPFVRSVFALDANNVWAVGIDGRISYSSNGGVNWIQRSLPMLPDLLDVTAVSTSEIHVVGEWGTVATSTDGASNTWTVHDKVTSNRLWTVMAPAASTAVATGGGLSIIETSNGGALWTPRIAEWGSLHGVAAVDAQVAYAVGSAGKLVKTSNGTNWVAQTSNTTNNLWSIDEADATHAWAVGDDSTIIATVNGIAWATQSSGVPAGIDLYGVAAVSQQMAWVVGEGGTILRTTNGGATWSAQTSGVPDTLLAIDNHGMSVAWAVGDDNTIIRSVNGGQAWTAPPSMPADWAVWKDIDVVDADTVWIIGSSTQNWRTDDAGVTWTATAKPANTSDQYAVSAPTSQIAFAAGPGGGMVHRTRDGGATWTNQAPSVNWTELYDVDAVDAEVAWVVGDAGYIDKRTVAVAAADWNDGVDDWNQGGSAFGVCLQAIDPLTTSTDPAWTVDNAGVAGECEADDNDPWRSIPTTSSKVGWVSDSGDVGRIDLVWGWKVPSTHVPGTYTAGVTIEVLAPNV